MVGVNWKMHLTPTEAASYLDTLRGLVADLDDRDIFCCRRIPRCRRHATGSAAPVSPGVPRTSTPRTPGPHTGDVSAAMLADLGCRFVMVGHTERRRDHGESHDLVGAKVVAVTRHGMVPIICIGEPGPVGPQAALDVVLADLARATSRLDTVRPARRSWSRTNPAGPSDRAWKPHHPR